MRAGVTLFCGQTQTGKTTQMLRELAAERPRPRALLFDPQRDAKLDRWPSIESVSAARAFLSSARSRGSWTRTVRGDFALYEALARTVQYWRGVLWIVDDSQSLWQRRPILDAAERVAATGRHMGHHAGVELWVIAQRPMLVPVTVRSQATRLRSFFQDEPNDLKYLGAKAGRAFAERVRALGPHELARWPDDRATARATLRLVR